MGETPSSSATRVIVALRPEDRPLEAPRDRLRPISCMVHFFNVKVRRFGEAGKEDRG